MRRPAVDRLVLDEVHWLREEQGYKRFALTGSSARKLKRGAANLLAGRAIVRHLYPFTMSEMGFAAPIRQLLRFGSLPMSVTAADHASREECLRAYVTPARDGPRALSEPSWNWRVARGEKGAEPVDQPSPRGLRLEFAAGADKSCNGCTGALTPSEYAGAR